MSKQCIKSRQELQFEAVTLHKHHPEWSLCAIVKKMQCSHYFISRRIARYEQFGHVINQPRPGRPHKADAAAVQHICMAAAFPERFSARDIAAQVQQDSGAKFSTSTVKRILRKEGLTHMSPKVAPLLTAQHKLHLGSHPLLQLTEAEIKHFLYPDSI